MAGIKGTRVDVGAAMPKGDNQRSNDKLHSSGGASVGMATNAKKPVSGTQNEARASEKSVAPKTRES